jgi:pimeloyl-ACP methyl ester carboxylesterase
MAEKTPWLLLHGALGYKVQLERLQQCMGKNSDVYSINFRGHGGDTYSGPFDMNEFVEDILQFLNDRGLSVCNIFGYSMGGYVALLLARKYPERVKNIFTLGTKFDWDPVSARKEVSLLDPEVMENKIPAFAKLLEERFYPVDWKDAVRRTADMMLGLGQNPGLTKNDLAEIHQNVIISAGSKDNMVSLEYSRQTAENLPNGRYLEWDGWPHPIEKADAEVLANAIASFNSGNG